MSNHLAIEFIKDSQLVVGALGVQCEKLYSIHYNGDYAEWEQGVANFAMFTMGLISLDTALKAFNFIIDCNKIFRIVWPLGLLPSAIFFTLNGLDITNNKCFKFVKNLHMNMDQVGNIAILISQVVFIYFGAPLFGLTGLGIILNVVSLYGSRIGTLYHQIHH